MKWVEPKVFKIAESIVALDGMEEYLREIGAEGWLRRQPWRDAQAQSKSTRADALIEVAGRTCYKSFGVGLNPNVTKVRDSPLEYFRNVLSKGDGSILEHGSITLAFVDVSRVFTHELVRHRAGTAISQESLRYVRPKELRMTLVPGSELARIPNMELLSKRLEDQQTFYERSVAQALGEDSSFDEKKAWTSALRRILPDGIATNLVWTVNHRALRWIIEMRTSPAAEVEMRYVFDKVARIVTADYPLIYQDFGSKPHTDGVGAEWTPKLRSKV